MPWQKPPSSHVSGVSFAAAGLTRGGKIRGVNEDAVLVQALSSSHLSDGAPGVQGDTSMHGIALGVFDGMGGSGVGDVASQLAAATVGDHLRRAFDRAVDVTAWAQALHEAMDAANQAIFRLGQADVRMRFGGAAAIVATVSGATLIVGHVDDGRACLLRGGKLTSLTRADHSLLAGLDLTAPVESLEELEAAARRWHAMATSGLGTKESIDVEDATFPLCEGDTLLLCTNGVELPDEQIAALLSRSDPPEELCAALDAACAAGEVFDDRAVVVARFSGDEWT